MSGAELASGCCRIGSGAGPERPGPQGQERM
jgi:hypothetical protein